MQTRKQLIRQRDEARRIADKLGPVVLNLEFALYHVAVEKKTYSDDELKAIFDGAKAARAVYENKSW